MRKIEISEDVRYRVYRFGAHFAWWSAFAWTSILTWMNITRPATQLPSTFQRVSGLFIILLMGLGISLGLALSRMRLAKTISRVFEVGVTVASEGAQDRQKEIIKLLRQDIETKEAARR